MAHKRVRRLLVLSVTGAVALLSTGCAEDLGSLGGGFATATGINDLGQVVGVSSTADGVRHAYAYDPVTKVMRNLGEGMPTGISDTGRVVGEVVLADGHKAAVTWDLASPSGSRTVLPRVGWDWERMIAVNHDGLAVGAGGKVYPFGPGNPPPWHWPMRGIAWAVDGTRTEVGALPVGEPNTLANDVNDAGQIVGQAGNDVGGFHAFLADAKGIRELVSPPGPGAIAKAINDAGDAVGYAGGDEPVWWDTTTLLPHTFPDLHGARISVLVDVNDAGVAVGQGHPAGDPSNDSADEHAFCINLHTGVLNELGPGSVAAAINNHNVMVGSLGDRATKWTDLGCMNPAP